MWWQLRSSVVSSKGGVTGKVIHYGFPHASYYEQEFVGALQQNGGRKRTLQCNDWQSLHWHNVVGGIVTILQLFSRGSNCILRCRSSHLITDPDHWSVLANKPSKDRCAASILSRWWRRGIMLSFWWCCLQRPTSFRALIASCKALVVRIMV